MTILKSDLTAISLELEDSQSQEEKTQSELAAVIQELGKLLPVLLMNNKWV